MKFTPCENFHIYNCWNLHVYMKLLWHHFIVPRFRESVGTLNLIRLSVRPSVPLSVCPSVRHKNFNLGHNFCTITDRALILGMCVLCDKTFPMVPCRDLDRDLWPRSNLLASGGPQFSEFACWLIDSSDIILFNGYSCMIVFYATRSNDLVHIVFVPSVCWFACLFACVFVCCQLQHLNYNFRTVGDKDFILGMHT